MKLEKASDEMDDEVFVNIRSSPVLPSIPKPIYPLATMHTNSTRSTLQAHLIRNLAIDVLNSKDNTIVESEEWKSFITVVEEYLEDTIGSQYASITRDSHQPDLGNLTIKNERI